MSSGWTAYSVDYFEKPKSLLEIELNGIILFLLIVDHLQHLTLRKLINLMFKRTYETA